MAGLAESEEKFKDFTELATDWTWETDERFRFTFRRRTRQTHKRRHGCP